MTDLITEHRSPNFGDRKLPISLVILHYTGMESGQAALERLNDAEAQVSAHYLVEEDGRIFRLVDEDKRAWHAGVSSWRGITDINSASIGIEIVNGGHDYGLPDFPNVQIEAVIHLCRAIKQRHKLDARAFQGHSDIAPGRKNDPGEKFPWDYLAEQGIGVMPEPVDPDRRILFTKGTRDRGVSLAQRALAHIGYGVDVTGQFDQKLFDCVEAFQRRYRPDDIRGHIDVETMGLISKLSEKY